MKKLLLFTAMLIAFGVNAQLRLVKDLRSGSPDSTPTSFFVYDGKLFFSATINSGRFVYSTDGTDAGTVFVRFGDALTGTPAVNTFGTTLFYEYNNNLYFDARINSTANIQIVKLSGASNAVSSIFDLTAFTGTQLSRFTETAGLNNKLLFNPLVGTSLDPIVLDLQNSANSGLLHPIYSFANPSEFTVIGTNCFFTATSQANGRELWKTDGTSTGTSLSVDVYAGAGTGDVKSLNVLNNQLTFVAKHANFGIELFRTNGSGSLTLLKDINSGLGDSSPSFATVIGGLLYFSADDGTTGRELYTSGGTTLTTNLLKDINPSGDSNPSKFTKIGSTVYFIANDGTNGVELWKTDGTAVGTTLVKNINSTGSSSPNYLTEYNGKLYFTANNGVNGNELWTSDGTDIGTTLVVDVFPGGTSSGISGLTVFSNELFFSATVTSLIGQELYAYKDPTLATADFQLSQNTITLFPNPSKSYFELSGDATIKKVEIYSMLGQVVKTFEAQNQYAISDLAKGNYIVKINTTEGESSKALIVE
jgi:trimeric autotransporter adhesin